jgi:hypothetical protein
MHDVLENVPASDGSAYREYVLTPKGRLYCPSCWRCDNGENNSRPFLSTFQKSESDRIESSSDYFSTAQGRCSRNSNYRRWLSWVTSRKLPL